MLIKGSEIGSWWLVVDDDGRYRVVGLADNMTAGYGFGDSYRGNHRDFILIHKLRYFIDGLGDAEDRPKLLDPFTVVEKDGRLLYKVEDPEMIALITKNVLTS